MLNEIESEAVSGQADYIILAVETGAIKILPIIKQI